MIDATPMKSRPEPVAPLTRIHPRTIGWIGTAALAMGGSNQSLFLVAALFGGQGDIPGQGSASIVLLAFGLLLSYAATPGWIELVLMSPNRVGGIAASCSDAFKPYSVILSALAGVCYWWGWVPTCGLTALFSATAINQWALPQTPIPVIACCLVVLFALVNLAGIRWVTWLSIPIATVSAGLAFVSMLAPVVAGTADWSSLGRLHLVMPFPGVFGGVTSMMAGLYLIGFAAPAFEAATCHVAETIDENRNVPRAVYAAAAMAAVFFVGLPVVWFCVLGADPLSGDLGQVLGPTFAPLFGGLAKSAAIWFMMFNMFHGTMQPLAGAARTLSQLSDDGLLPRISGSAFENRRTLGGHAAHRGVLCSVPVDRRSDLARRSGELHLSHRHMSAEYRGLASAPRCSDLRRGPGRRRVGRSNSASAPHSSGSLPLCSASSSSACRPSSSAS